MHLFMENFTEDRVSHTQRSPRIKDENLVPVKKDGVSQMEGIPGD